MDHNYGNERQLVPLQRRFTASKEELDGAMRELYGLGEKDSDVPQNFEIYETD